MKEVSRGGGRRLLSQRALAIAAERLGVAPYLMLGRGFESTGGRHNEAVLGDVMESLIAALYLDGGYSATRDFVLSALAGEIESASDPDWRPDNPKADLQELLQGKGRPTPNYRVVDSSGPAHAPQFTVEVLVDGEPMAWGSGRSKHAAETEAARAALADLSGHGAY